MALNIGFAFDATQEDFESSGVGKMPVGRQIVEIIGGQPKQTNGKNSGYLELHLKVIRGKDAGRVGPLRLNFWPEDPNSEQGKKSIVIARQALARLCHVTNVFGLPDGNVDPLFGIPFMVESTFQPGEEDKLEADRYTEIKPWAIYDATGQLPRKGEMACTVPPSETPVPYSAPAPAAPPVQPAAAPAWPAQTQAAAAAPQQQWVPQQAQQAPAPAEQARVPAQANPWQPNAAAPAANAPWGKR